MKKLPYYYMIHFVILKSVLRLRYWHSLKNQLQFWDFKTGNQK